MVAPMPSIRNIGEKGTDLFAEALFIFFIQPLVESYMRAENVDINIGKDHRRFGPGLPFPDDHTNNCNAQQGYKAVT